MQNKLYVIGNGFDIVHNLPTKYAYFRQYILDRYPNSLKYQDIPESILMPDGEEIYNDAEVAGYIIKVIDSTDGEDWNCLESCLGNYIYSEFISEANRIDIEDEDNVIWRNIYANEDKSLNILNTFVKIKQLFRQWVKEELSRLDMSGIKKNNIEVVLDPNAHYLTFNYTDTLENAYSIAPYNICHIHGKATDNNNIFFGHGDIQEIQNSFDTLGMYDSLAKLKRILYKDTEKALFDKTEFFKGLTGVNEVYSYGFSFSDVDMIYIDTISKYIITKDTIWYLNSYDKDKIQYKEKLKQYGFNVKIENMW